MSCPILGFDSQASVRGGLSWPPYASRSGAEGAESPSAVPAFSVSGPGTHRVHPVDETVLG